MTDPLLIIGSVMYRPRQKGIKVIPVLQLLHDSPLNRISGREVQQ
jgi:hypothetical protein